LGLDLAQVITFEIQTNVFSYMYCEILRAEIVDYASSRFAVLRS